MVTGRESDKAVGAVAQHATVPSQSETREAVGAVVQHATVPGESLSLIAKVGFCRMPASYLPVAGSRPPERAL